MTPVTAAETAELSGDTSTDAIAALLEERRRYEGWLTTLEQRRPTTAPHVYSRVRQDYEGRLSQVLEQLRGRSAELQSTVDLLASRVAALENDEESRRDERAEAELRAAVGEYSPEQWDELNKTAEQELERLAGERGAAAGELAQLQELLTLASSERVVPPPPSQVASPSLGDEIDFMKAMAEPARPVAPPPEPKAPPVAPPPRPAPTASAAAPSATAGGGASSGKSDKVPAFLRDVPVEQVKSLKCSECGTMNYPTEWYCERCGGELAAM